MHPTVPESFATLIAEVPYDGVSSIAGMGFALDQFSRTQGFHSFAEWAAAHFQQARSIAGSVVRSDELETADKTHPDRTNTSFGYEVTIWVNAADDE